MTPNARANEMTSMSGSGSHRKSGPRSAATAGSPIQPMASEQRVTPSCDAEMYWSSRSTRLADSRARALPCCTSSSSCVFLMRTKAYSAATKNPFARTSSRARPNATSALVSMDMRFSHLRYAHTVRVLVRLFASYREAAGRGHFDLELPAGSTVRDAIARILNEHPLIAEGRQVVIARNREYVGVDEPLADGDELALIPPVSGGDARTLAAIAVSESPLSVDDALAVVRDDAFGGVVVFIGTVRSRSHGKRILHLEYEAYAEMAEAKMRDISERLSREHGPLRIAMHHRVGDLRVGDIAVVVAVAAPHRDAAFAAARLAIDELK